MKNFKRNFYILLFISFLACLALGWYAYDQRSVSSSKSLQIAALNDTVTIYKTKDGKNGAYIKILQGTKKEVEDILRNKNPRLANVVKSTPGIKSVTNLKVLTTTDTVVKIDTLYLPGIEFNKKLFLQKTIRDKYYIAKVVVEDDSLSLKVNTFNDFDFMSRDKSNGFLKRKSYIIDVINLNPNTTTLGLQSYEITPKPKTGLKVTIGLVLGIAAGVLILK